MKIHRFIDELEWHDKTVATTNKELIHQLQTVLKIKIGELLILGDGRNKEAEVSLLSLNKERAEFTILKTTTREETVKRKVHLFVAVVKRDNFAWIVQKAVEAGVTSITPIITERTIKTGLNYERLSKIMHEATEQSGRITLSTLNPQQSFKEALEEVTKLSIPCYIGDSEGAKTVVDDAKEVALFIGPEGGFTPAEKLLASNMGVIPISFGSTTLRAETAAVIGVFVLTNQ